MHCLTKTDVDMRIDMTATNGTKSTGHRVSSKLMDLILTI